MLSNKDKLFLANLQASFKEFVAADIGKAAKADLAAIEKAAGGKKKLDEADKILKDADLKAKAKIEAAGLEAQRIVASGNARAKAALEGIEDRANKVREAESDLGDLKASVEKMAAAVSARETEVEARAVSLREIESALAEREARIGERERRVGVREKEVRRFDEWRKAAPA